MLVWVSYWLEDCCMGSARGLISTLHAVDSKTSRVFLRTLIMGTMVYSLIWVMQGL